ncbi:MAG TPA: hypothetical protein VHA78_03490 [Candidatus Peribacteraceae bacterium]|nr:hypothetical protein [Candidatus Peribacteraceae bacterium]
MNRIPLDFGSSRYTGNISELKRAQQLWDGVFDGVTHILDVHSADQPLPGGLTLDIAGERSVLDTISDALPAAARLAEITPVQKAESKNQPFGCLAGHGAAVALEVEAGAHEDEPGIRVAVETAVSFLKALDCIEGDVEEGSPTAQDVYDVRGVVRVPDASYRIASTELLPNFAPIAAGQPIAVSKGKQPVVAPEDGHLIFGPEGLEISEQLAKEEVFFRLGPVQRRERTQQVPTWFTQL